jgi:hypothetical protein
MARACGDPYGGGFSLAWASRYRALTEADSQAATAMITASGVSCEVLSRDSTSTRIRSSTPQERCLGRLATANLFDLAVVHVVVGGEVVTATRTFMGT